MGEITVKYPFHSKGLKLDGLHFALVDDDMLNILSPYKWAPTKQGNVIYARCGNITMHRLIMGFPDGLDVHHINGNGLDNRKENLITLTPSEHARVPKR